MNYEWHRRALDSIHGGALTNSKRPESFVKGIFPSHVIRGEGCYLFDTENKKYIDYICGLGTNLLGYANTQVNDAVINQLHKGAVYSLSSTLEVEAAEKLKEIFPFVDKLRFLKTGSDASAAAIRIARAHHGVEYGSDSRSLILSDGYHGHDSSFVSITKPRVGVPYDANMLPLKDNFELIKDAAAVIIEPIITDMSPARIHELRHLQAECQRHGTLLIFDEIITGFRFPKFSFCNFVGIQPDILLLGKCIAGGLPLSVVATKKDIAVGREWFISSTFAGDTLALAGMIKTIDLLKNTYSLERLWEAGKYFQTEFNNIAPEIVKIEGYPSRGVFVAEPLNKALFFQESCKAGILFGPSFFYNFHHMQLNHIVLSSCKDILLRIKHNQVELEGEMPKVPFAQAMREKT